MTTTTNAPISAQDWDAIARAVIRIEAGLYSLSGEVRALADTVHTLTDTVTSVVDRARQP